MIDATVIIPSWNAATLVARSIESAKSQKKISCEVVVVDDASSDGTVDVLAQTPDIHFETLEKNGGPAAARNRALDVATGNWIVVLDSDDTMADDRVWRMIKEAEETGADIVLGNFQTVDCEGVAVTTEPFLDKAEASQGAFLTLEEYIGRNQVSPELKSIGYLKPIMSRNFIETKNLRYNEELRNGEDCHLIFEALIQGAKVIISAVPDYYYTSRSGSVSYRITPSHISDLVKADDNLRFLHGDKLSQKTHELFDTRRARLLKMQNSEQTLIALKEKRYLTAAKNILAHPNAAMRTLRQLYAALSKRLVGQR